MALNTPPVTSSQPPQTTNPARDSRSRQVTASPTTRNNSARGSSHPIWPPMSVPNIRSQPVLPQPRPCPPPTLPVSSPVSRPNPL